jgi:hypothetical protein
MRLLATITLTLLLLVIPVLGLSSDCTAEGRNYTISDVGYNYLRFDVHGDGFVGHELTGYYVYMMDGENQWNTFEILDNTNDAVIISPTVSKVMTTDLWSKVGTGYIINSTSFNTTATIGSMYWYIDPSPYVLDYGPITRISYWETADKTNNNYYATCSACTAGGCTGYGYDSLPTTKTAWTYYLYDKTDISLGETYTGIRIGGNYDNSVKCTVNNVKFYFQGVEMDSFNAGDTIRFYDFNTGLFYCEDEPSDTPASISVSVFEKYSNAIIVNQGVTVTPIIWGSGETKTSLYGETLHFEVTPGATYWFNASRPGYMDYNQTYTIPASPGIYNIYMERTLTPIADHSYAHFSVVDQTNGGLIPNAEIRLSDGQTKLTNSAGYTWFSVNNSEQINYYVSKPSGYWPAYGAMNLTADESILVALQRYTGPTATATMPGWTPVTVPTTGTGSGPVVTLSAQLREQNVQEGMDVWYTNLPFISQFLFLLFIIGGLGLMAGGTRRN